MVVLSNLCYPTSKLTNLIEDLPAAGWLNPASSEAFPTHRHWIQPVAVWDHIKSPEPPDGQARTFFNSFHIVFCHMIWPVTIPQKVYPPTPPLLWL